MHFVLFLLVFFSARKCYMFCALLPNLCTAKIGIECRDFVSI